MPSPWTSLDLLNPSVLFFNPAPWKWDSPHRPHYNLWICLEGAGCIRAGNTKAIIRPGLALLIPPAAAVFATGETSQGILNAAFHFHLDFVDQTRLSALMLHPVQIRRPSLVRELCHHLEETIQWSLHDGESDAIARTIWGIFARDFQMPVEPSVNRLLRAHAERIKSNPPQAPSVPELAAEAGFSTAHYTRRFRKLHGKAPKEFAVDEKNAVAARLLRETRMAIKEIADALGFVDVAFFSKQFKSRYGTSPGDWRNTGRPAERLMPQKSSPIIR